MWRLFKAKELTPWRLWMNSFHSVFVAKGAVLRHPYAQIRLSPENQVHLPSAQIEIYQKYNTE